MSTIQPKTQGTGQHPTYWKVGEKNLSLDTILDEVKFVFSPLPEEAPPQHGELYQLQPTGADGTWKVLKSAGQTSPNGQDIPADAVVNNRVVIGVEGINSDPSYYTNAFTHLMEHAGPGTTNLGQPILMVHEGIDKNLGQSLVRMGADYLAMKAIEGGHTPSVEGIFKRDPAVQTTYNMLKQSLDQGHQVLVLAHSGGGMISALTLNLLSRAEGGKYQPLIHQNVRTFSMAGAGAPQDYVDAGQKPENVLYVGDHRDAVAIFGDDYVDPHHPLQGIETLARRVHEGGIDFSLGAVHDVNNIFPESQAQVLSFLAGGPGGSHLA
ncbi:MAG TPA: hypothetical protein VGO93_24340 [Candidatus Xenobia bacterium]|jgi:hypothetical protein